VHEKLIPYGVGGEVFSQGFPLLDLTVPACADIARVKVLPARGEEEGWWHYEVSCTTDEWNAA